MTRYVVDSSRSVVWFEGRSSLHPIRAETNQVTGWLDVAVTSDGNLDLSTPPAGGIEVAVGGLSSGNPLYDAEIRRRADARRYPVITAALAALVAGAAGGAAGRFTAAGTVTYRGADRPVSGELQFSFPDGASVRIEGSHIFDMRDFGLDPPRILMLKVSPSLEVGMTLVAARPA